MPFPAGRSAPRRGDGGARPLLAAAAAAQLVTFPAGAVVSEYVGAGAPAVVTSGLAGLACAAAARAAADRAAGPAGGSAAGRAAGRAAATVPAVAAGYAVLVVGLAFRLVPGGADPAPRSGGTLAMYAVAVLVAAVSGWRR